MRTQAVSGLFLLAAIWTGLALWARDGRGLYIAAFCVVLGTVAMFRSAD